MIQPIRSSTQIVNPNGLPVTSGPDISGRWLEVRLNSTHDAKSAVQNQADILGTVKKFGFEGIEFLIAKELESQIQAIIGGAFNCKTLYGRIAPRAVNVHYSLPAFMDLAPAKGKHVAVGRPEAATQEPVSANAELDQVAAANGEKSEFDDDPAPATTPATKPSPRKRAAA
jgi:hypothetical protein